MQDIEIELGVGDAVRIGDSLYTVIDIEGGEVSFRVDTADDFAFLPETVPPGK